MFAQAWVPNKSKHSCYTISIFATPWGHNTCARRFPCCCPFGVGTFFFVAALLFAGIGRRCCPAAVNGEMIFSWPNALTSRLPPRAPRPRPPLPRPRPPLWPPGSHAIRGPCKFTRSTEHFTSAYLAYVEKLISKGPRPVGPLLNLSGRCCNPPERGVCWGCEWRSYFLGFGGSGSRRAKQSARCEGRERDKERSRRVNQSFFLN